MINICVEECIHGMAQCHTHSKQCTPTGARFPKPQATLLLQSFQSLRDLL